MESISTTLLDNFLIEPYNYIISITDYVYVPDINNIIENTSKSYELINDTFYLAMSELSINDFSSFIIEYKYFIFMMLVFDIFLIYFIMTLIENYFTKIDKKYYKNKPKIVNNSIHKNTSNKLYIDSLFEINANNKNILSKINSNGNNYYYALLRIKLKSPIEMNNTNTNYNLHTIITETDKKTDSDTFSTNDMYMIIKFNYNHNNSTPILFSEIIVNILNILNSLSIDKYKSDDFIVLVISKNINPSININEFTSGLKYINYDFANFKNIILSKDNKIGFILLLPIKQVYDLFLDVHNDILFESTSYKIDYDNNEYWYTNTI
jgi:hypothetical protein